MDNARELIGHIIGNYIEAAMRLQEYEQAFKVRGAWENLTKNNHTVDDRLLIKGVINEQMQQCFLNNKPYLANTIFNYWQEFAKEVL